MLLRMAHDTLEQEGRQRLFWVRPYGPAMGKSIGHGVFYLWVMMSEVVSGMACM